MTSANDRDVQCLWSAEPLSELHLGIVKSFRINQSQDIKGVPAASILFGRNCEYNM